MEPRKTRKVHPGRAVNIYVRPADIAVWTAGEALAKLRDMSLSSLLTDALRGELQRAAVEIPQPTTEVVRKDEVTEHMLEAGGTIHWFKLIKVAGTTYLTVKAEGLAAFYAMDLAEAETKLKNLLTKKRDSSHERL